MSPLEVALATLLCASGAAALGIILHATLPEHHLDPDSRDVVKLVMGLIATMAALVLGLLIASAQGFYASQSAELEKLAANVVAINRSLAQYGPEADRARVMLREAVATAHDRIWSGDRIRPEYLEPIGTRSQAGQFFEALQALSPRTDAQRFAQSQALQLTSEIVQTRLLMFEQSTNSVSWPFVVVLVSWVSVLFLGFGLFARLHATVACALFIGALSVAAAMFLILELNGPYTGWIRLSDAPLLRALAEMATPIKR